MLCFSEKKMSSNVETLTGYIVDPNVEVREKNISDEEAEDEVEEEDFMEMHDISAVTEGAFQTQTRSVANKKVSFRYRSGKKPIFISGPFLFTEVWWEIEVDVNMKTKNVQHTPRYRLKMEWKEEDVIQYLNQCHVEEVPTSILLIQRIFDKNVFSLEDVLEFTDLQEKIREGGALFSEQDSHTYEMIRSHLSASPFSALVHRAANFPNLYWQLQAVLPKKAFAILAHNLELPGTRKRDRSKGDNQEISRGPDFQGLNEALEENPWEFAFSRVLYKKYNVSGCEAKLSDLEKSGVFDKLDDIKKDSIIVYDKLKNYCWRYGHTYMKCPGRKKFSNLAQHYCRDRSKTQMFLCSERIRALKCEPRSVHSNMPRLFLWKYWKAEKNIALYLRRILAGDCEDEAETRFFLPPLKNEEWEELDENQKLAVEYIRTKPLTVLSGMGGCGKTTVVSKLVTSYCEFDSIEGSMRPKEAFSEPGDHCILLTAPTGKAASLLGKKCGLPACTIHSVIYSHMAWKTSRHDERDSKKEPAAPEKKGWKFAGTKMLVVDECSMVAVTTFERLVKILLDESSLCKLVLIGDIRQLPSIEPGNFFEDIFQVASKYRLGVDLKTNHRVDAGGKSIVKNAKRISLKTMPKFDEERLALPESRESRFIFLEIVMPEGRSGSEDAMRSKARDATMQRLDELLDTNWTGLRDHTKSQIITFTRKLVADGNQSCCKHYNKHFTHNNNKREFKEGDKICCRKNCKIANPFYKPKVGDANTGAGFSAGNHERKEIRDNTLSVEEALSNIFGENQEKTGREEDNVLLSHQEKGNGDGTSPWQQGDKREQVEGDFQVREEDMTLSNGIQVRLVPEELVSMEMTEENEMHRKEGRSENADMNGEINRGFERDDMSTGDPSVGAHASLMCEPSTSARTAASEEGEGGGKNTTQSAEVGERDGEEEDEQYYRICNGDTFIIKEIKDVWDDGRNKWKPAALLDDMESDQMWVDFTSFRRTGRAEHAWCRTIHTFQGSEVKTVVYLISSCKSESWKHVYTAVTRGKEEVVVIGPRKYLREALLTEYVRDTGLKGFFQKELENWQRMKPMDGSIAEYSCFEENSGNETEEAVTFIEGTPGNTTSNWDMLSSPGGHSVTGTSEGSDVSAVGEDCSNFRDILPFGSYFHGDIVTEESVHNSEKEDVLSTMKPKEPSFPSGQHFTELRDSQPTQDLSVGELRDPLPTSRFQFDSEGFCIPETVTPQSNFAAASKNQNEPSVLNSAPSDYVPILPERLDQEDESAGTMSPSRESEGSQAGMASPIQSLTDATQFQRHSQKDSQQTVGEKENHSLDHSLKFTTPEKKKNYLDSATLTSPSGMKYSFKNRRESSIINSPSPPRMHSKESLPERKDSPQSPEQRDKFVGVLSSPSKEVSNHVMSSPGMSLNCSTQFKKHLHKSSQSPMGEDSPDFPKTPEKDETDLGPESEELENLTLVSPMDTGQGFNDQNRSGARKRLHFSSVSHETAAKSPKKMF